MWTGSWWLHWKRVGQKWYFISYFILVTMLRVQLCCFTYLSPCQKKKTHNKPTKKPTPLLSKICMQRFTRSEVCYRNRKKIHSVQPKIWVELREKLASLVKQSSFNFSPFSISDTNKYLLDVRKSRVKFCWTVITVSAKLNCSADIRGILG